MANNTTTPQKETLTAVGPGADEDETRIDPNGGSPEPAAGDDYAYRGGEEEGEDTRDAGDERTGRAEESGEGTQEDGHLSREQKRRRRKRARRDQDDREMAFLRSRNEQLEREQSRRLADVENRQTQNDVLAIDTRISQAEKDVSEAEELLRQAMEAKDSGAAVEAMKIRDQFTEGLRQMRGAKAQTMRSAQERRNAPSQEEADPVITQRAAEWLRDNPWFDEKLRDTDSRFARVEEVALSQEGRFNPRTDAYWDELDRRLAKRMPEHYRDDDVEDERDRDREVDDGSPRRREEPVRRNSNGNSRRPSGPNIRVGGRERPLRKGEVYIDEDRKAAMIEAGVWHDVPTRNRYLASYQRYDRDNGRRRH